MTAAHAFLAIVLILLAVPMGVLLTPLAMGALVLSLLLWRLNSALQPEWRPVAG